ncbi:immunity 53 family protein [Neorhizobium galegae]|nr:immunity 53 family protein [Neorhizobium galegae]
MDVLDWFGRWYEAQCDGAWEHGFGASIDTLDNPGWSLKIDLAGTDTRSDQSPLRACGGLVDVLDRGQHVFRRWRPFTFGRFLRHF